MHYLTTLWESCGCGNNKKCFFQFYEYTYITYGIYKSAVQYIFTYFRNQNINKLKLLDQNFKRINFYYNISK